MPEVVLIVDDDPVQRRLIENMVQRFGYQPMLAEGGDAAARLLTAEPRPRIDCVVLDLVMPDLDGLGVMARMREAAIDIPVIVQTAHGGIDNVVSAMRAGASDFVVKPAGPERLQVSLRNALSSKAMAGELQRLKRKHDGTLDLSDVITRSGAMRPVLKAAEKAAASTIPVLIEGESGTGKELIARAIHGAGERRAQPFVAVNCGALPENLVESILFGHEKGAFTGATEKHMGKFVEADGGTLFLDEIGELPLDAQVKLLRALQEGEIDPVGSKRALKVDFRLISATNRNMIQLVRDGKFREDLFYRMNVFPIWVPPLRERLVDVPELAQHFMARFAAEEGKRISGITDDALRLLKTYPWPGNVRQLENAVFRAVVLADGPELTVAEFPQIAAHVTGFETAIPPAPALKQMAFKGPALLGAEHIIPQTIEIRNGGGDSALGIPVVTDAGEIRPLDEIEADMIRLALGRYRGHMTEVAKRLKIGRSTLYRKMQEYGLEPRA
jgi:DNA-binding NtrC family response regulator